MRFFISNLQRISEGWFFRYIRRTVLLIQENMKQSLKQVRPEDFDVEVLMAAAREGRLYVGEGNNHVNCEREIVDVRGDVVGMPECIIGSDEVHLLIETVKKLSDAYEQLAQQLTNNVGEEPDNSQTKSVDNHVPSFDEMMQVFKKAKNEGLWNCKRSWGVGYQMWKIWGWKGTVLEFVHLAENSKEVKEFEYKCNQDAVYKMISKGHMSLHLENWRKDGVLKRHRLLGEFINDELQKTFPPKSPKV